MVEQKTGNGIEAREGVDDADLLRLIGDLAKLDEKEAVRIIAENPQLLGLIKCPEEMQLVAVKQDGGKYGFALKYIENPSEAVKLAAVKKDGYAIKFIKNPTEELQLAAVTAKYQYGTALEHIEKPSEAVQLAAVMRDGSAIRYIQNPSEAVQLAAVTQDGEAILYVKNPTEEMQLAAVKSHGNALRYIKNPSEEVQLAAVTAKDQYETYTAAIEHIENPSEAVQLAAVKRNCYAISFIKNPSEAVRLAAEVDLIKSFKGSYNYRNIGRIYKPWNSLMLAAIEITANAIYHIKEIPEAVWMAALKNAAAKQEWYDFNTLMSHSTDAVKLVAEELLLEAVKKDGGIIGKIDFPSEAVQLAAVKEDAQAIEYIKEPLQCVKDYAESVEKVKLALKLMKPKVENQALKLKTQPPKLAQ